MKILEVGKSRQRQTYCMKNYIPYSIPILTNSQVNSQASKYQFTGAVGQKRKYKIKLKDNKIIQ